MIHFYIYWLLLWGCSAISWDASSDRTGSSSSGGGGIGGSVRACGSGRVMMGGLCGIGHVFMFLCVFCGGRQEEEERVLGFCGGI